MKRLENLYVEFTKKWESYNINEQDEKTIIKLIDEFNDPKKVI